MSIELPELILVNFNNPCFSGFELIENIMHDSWLLNAGIIAFCSTYKEVEQIESIKHANIIIALMANDIDSRLNNILSIIFNNRRILFQRAISSNLIKNISGSFCISNDPYEAKCYANLICNFLYNSNRLSADSNFHLKLALIEMLLNAIEHGNCGITFDEKSQWMDKYFDIDSLIKIRLENPSIATRRVIFEYQLTPELGNFIITDEGNGFDWRNVKNAIVGDNILELHGRGILMPRSVVNNLTFNETGNRVSFEIDFQKENTSVLPGLFKSMNLCE